MIKWITLILIGVFFLFCFSYAGSMDVTLREYLEQRLDLQDKALQLHAKEMERRLEGLNELRAEVVKDRSQFRTKDVAEAEWKNFHVWQLSVNDRLTTIETRLVVWTSAIGVFFVVLQTIIFIWGRKQRWDDPLKRSINGGKRGEDC